MKSKNLRQLYFYYFCYFCWARVTRRDKYGDKVAKLATLEASLCMHTTKLHRQLVAWHAYRSIPAESRADIEFKKLLKKLII